MQVARFAATLWEKCVFVLALIILSLNIKKHYTNGVCEEKSETGREMIAWKPTLIHHLSVPLFCVCLQLSRSLTKPLTFTQWRNTEFPKRVCPYVCVIGSPKNLAKPESIESWHFLEKWCAITKEMDRMGEDILVIIFQHSGLCGRLKTKYTHMY